MKNLKDHKHIGWDFDGTLFQHHNTPMFVDFIKSNPFDQVFHIVTFRSHGLRADIPYDLDTIGLSPENFASINSVSDEFYEAFYLATRRGNDREIVRKWREWKGETCLRIGADVLIDDMTADVVPGCDLHKIRHIHPDELRDWRSE